MYLLQTISSKLSVSSLATRKPLSMLDCQPHFLYRGEKKYILEAQSFEGRGAFVHVGHVDWLFDSKKQAAKFYRRYQPGMRDINAHDTWTSDWHPQTKLRFVLHKHKRGTVTSIRYCRPLISTQKEALQALNQAVRRENSKNKDWPRVILPAEELQEQVELRARQSRHFHENEYRWAEEAVVNAHDEGYHPVEHLAEEFDIVCAVYDIDTPRQGSVIVARALLQIGAIPTRRHLESAICKKFEGIVGLLLEDGRVLVDTEMLMLATRSSRAILRLLLGHQRWDTDLLRQMYQTVEAKAVESRALLQQHLSA
ncbi:Hypothetical protein POVR2_LOCUS94 [uncultured virus]|nr:Hypothetical protein POVR2_LOCUS94 [uncultured virus]